MFYILHYLACLGSGSVAVSMLATFMGSSVYEFRLEYVFLCYPSLNDTVGCRTCSREIPNF